MSHQKKITRKKIKSRFHEEHESQRDEDSILVSTRAHGNIYGRKQTRVSVVCRSSWAIPIPFGWGSRTLCGTPCRKKLLVWKKRDRIINYILLVEARYINKVNSVNQSVRKNPILENIFKYFVSELKYFPIIPPQFPAEMARY